MELMQLIQSMTPQKARRLAVAAAADEYVLTAVEAARAQGIASPILCGDAAAITKALRSLSIDPQGYRIVDAPDDAQAAQAAVGLVRAGEADMLMKGLLPTATLLRAVLDKEKGLRVGAGTLSHVSILHSPILSRRLLLTDAAMVPYPDLDAKVALIANAVRAANGLGIQMPKVAALAAVEVVNPQMQATVDAALLTMMNRRGQIKGCVVDGPLAMDLALSQEAAAHKGVVSDVAGQADILLLHNIDAANSVLKTFTIAGNCLFGGLVMGAAAPIILTSRSDSAQSKLFSIACAASICGTKEEAS